jgi:hypothetical protein
VRAARLAVQFALRRWRSGRALVAIVLARQLLDSRDQEEDMNKKLDSLPSLDLEDLSLVTGGVSGASTALDIKRKQMQEQVGPKGGPPIKR